MIYLRNPDNIFVAILRLENELPMLVGSEGWTAISKILSVNLNQFWRKIDEKERRNLALELVALLKPHPLALKRLDEELKIIDGLRKNLGSNLNLFASELGLHPESVSKSVTIVLRIIPNETTVDHHDRHITLRPGGIGGLTSIKLQNIEPEIGEIAEFVAGGVMISADVIGLPHPLVIAAGILLVIRSFTNMMTIKISEREASVFWGIIVARDEDGLADIDTIVARTNAVRKKWGLRGLSKGEINISLESLQELKSINHVQGKPRTWQIVEHFHIVD